MKSILIGGAGITALALATAALAQQAAKPKVEAVYWLSAETVSGMASGLPSGAKKSLMLQLGSTRAAPAPTAEHLPPEALRAGERLPLVTPGGMAKKEDGQRDYRPGQAQAPKGRIALYWGCGETVAPGQPIVVDLAAIKPGAPSPLGAGPDVRAMMPPSSNRHATYGEWPNKRDGRLPGSASLVGEHLVKGNYSPDLRFTVAPANDFLAPLAPRNDALGSGAVKVSWPALANARGFILTVTGAREDGTIVIWTSSAVRMPGMALPDYIEQADLARLVQQRVLLAPQATECVVPAAVAKASESAMLMMTAYGSEGNYGSPREAPVGWGVKLRTKATYMGVLGADLAALMRGAVDDDADPGSSDHEGRDTPSDNARPKKKRGLLRGLGSVLGVPG